jgi:hypothetical protein
MSDAAIVSGDKVETLSLPASVVYRGRTYLLSETARKGLILTLVKSSPQSVDIMAQGRVG